MSTESSFGDRKVSVEESDELSEEWITDGTLTPATEKDEKKKEENEPVVRISVDVPESLHLKAKIDCARNKTTLAAMLRQMMIDKYRQSDDGDTDD